MAKFGRDRMPHIGSERPDEAGLKLIEQWIAGMNGDAATTAPSPDGRPPDKLLADPKSALLLARKLGRGELTPAERDALLAAAAKLPAGPVRDLFEGYLPADEKGERKLGSSPRPKTILASQGDSEPGREAVLVAGGQLRQLPPGRRPRHAGRAGPVDHRQAAFARGSAGEPPGAVAPDRAEVRRLSRPDRRRPLVDRPARQARREGRGAARRPRQGDHPAGQERAGTAALAHVADARRPDGRPDRPGSGRPARVPNHANEPGSRRGPVSENALHSPAVAQSPERPLMGEFMGVNGHTIQFKPELYSEVCRKVRDYHSLEWDVGKETDFPTTFPFARNGVHWGNVYGSWIKAGIEADVCVMFNNTPPDSWRDLPRDARAYGEAFAKAFGPSSTSKLVASVEIGNEPGNYSDERYREVFQAMAAGFRAGDPKLKVLTCNMTAGKSGRYEKSVECVKGLDILYDTLTIHTYAMADGWPTWRRSYPEDPKIEFLKTVEALIAWRNANAKGKDIWVTEFGWDASTKPRATTGDAAKWEGNVSDERQAQYLVRAFLLFAAMDVQRAYLYFFNDSDEPSFHAASGITRNFEPKPSFHAVAHLQSLAR